MAYTLTAHFEGCLTSGAVHNGAETSIEGTDTDLLFAPFWSADGSNLAERGWAYLKAYVSAPTGLLRWGLDKFGSCKLMEINTYVEAFDAWTAAQYLALKNYYVQGTCGAGFIAPVSVEAGTGIGPDLSWAYYTEGGNDYILDWVTE